MESRGRDVFGAKPFLPHHAAQSDSICRVWQVAPGTLPTLSYTVVWQVALPTMSSSSSRYAEAALQGPVNALPYPRCSLAAVEEALAPGSPSLARYLENVYGSAPRSQLVSWIWRAKDVLHFNHLPHAARIQGCSPPLGNASSEHLLHPTNKAAVPALATPAFYRLDCWSGYSRCFDNTALLWRFDLRDEDRICRGEPVHQGGHALASKSVLEAGLHGWVEVSHVNNCAPAGDLDRLYS